jgi:diguanylate cyclase (GGDEF)-like protein
VLLAAAVAVGLGIWLVGERLVLRRIDRLARAAARLSKGDLQSRAGLSGEDEIARAGRVFDEMASRLQDLVERTRGQREDLARQVRHLVLRRTREVSSLNRLVQILHACRSPDEVCRIVGEFMGEIFSGDRGAFLVMDPTRHKVRALAEFGGPEAPLDRRTWSVEDCWALRRGQIHRVEDTRKGLVCRHLGDAPFVASLCVPVIAHGEVLGVLHLENLNTVGSPGWIESRERLAATVAEQCALAIANLTLRETLREQTLRDPLTGLFNRRFLAEALAGERGQSWKQSGSVGVVMVDIDHFKKFNDLHGHDVGDAVLVAVAKRLAGSVRSDDLVCRIGGEEFVVVLPGLDVERSERRAEHLRRRVAALRVRHRGQTFGPVTVSAGVACWPLHGRLPSDLLRAADAALYQAKIAGRNRVIAAGRDRFLVSSVKAQAGD